MHNRAPRHLRRSRQFEALESKQLLAALVSSPVKVVPASPEVVSGNWKINFPGERLDAESSARQFLSTVSNQLFIRPDTNDLQLAELKHGLASSHTRFRQVIGGIPLHGATVTVNQAADGSIQNYYATTFAELNLPSAVGGLSFSQAESLAQQAASVVREYQPAKGELVWLPLSNQTARLAWRVEIYAEQPVGDFHTLIDAQSGRIYSWENRTAFDTGTGQVYQPNPYQTQGSGDGLSDNNDANSTPLTDERINVTLQGLDSGTGLLTGEYVDMASLNGASLPDLDANEPTRNYDYKRDDPRFEQVVIYHAIDSIQRYVHSLGFDEANPLPNGIRDFPTRANAHWNNDDQSFYQPGSDTLHFGDGGVDDGEDADIVAHEYGHAIQHDQNANWGGGETGAMGEGFGDYLAASFYAQLGDPNYQANDAACVGEWDATSYSGTTPPCLRRVDGTKQYPNDLIGNVHADGEIWSAALWNLRTEIGAAATDQLVLEHHFALPAGADMPTAAMALIAADINLNAGDNEPAIRNAFCDRGILSGEECGPVIPPGQIEGVKFNDANGNGVREAGEPGLANWRIYFDDNRNGQLDSFSGTRSSTEVPRPISDNSTTTSTLQVSGAPGSILDLNVTLDITHTFVNDLTVSLESPAGERINLIAAVGGGGNNFTNTTLDDQATVGIDSGFAPFTGSFRPTNPLATFNGMLANGTWTLRVADSANLDQGTLNSWSLSFGTLESSTLTDASGQYTLTAPTEGTHTIAEVQQEPWVQTFPASGAHLVTVSPGEVIENMDFGNRLPPTGAEVVGRHLFYNNSAFEGNDPAATAADSLAIATDKQPLLFGETATFANYTSYARGLNGVIIDVTNLADPTELSLADFEFRTGTDDTPADWPLAASPSLHVEPGGGAAGSDRLTLIWPDEAITNRWLQVQVKATANTGLSTADTFFFGNARGETGNQAGETTVDAADFQAIRVNGNSFLAAATIEDRFDVNRDRRVNAIDLLLTREYRSSFDDILDLITPSNS